MKNISPYLRVAMNHIANDLKLRERIIFDYELLYLKKGKIKLYIDSKLHTVNEKQMILIKPGQAHSFIGIGRCEMPHIHFDLIEEENSSTVPVNFMPKEKLDDSELEYIRYDMLGMLPNVITIPNHQEILNELYRIINIFEHRERYFELEAKSIITGIVHRLLKAGIIEDKDKTYYTVSNIAKYIRDNVENTISLDELSKKACLSKHYFERLFKNQFGISPMSYHRIQRLNRSKYYLMYSNLSITNIAELMNYSSIHAFSKEFKKYFGVSPLKYKNSNLG